MVWSTVPFLYKLQLSLDFLWANCKLYLRLKARCQIYCCYYLSHDVLAWTALLLANPFSCIHFLFQEPLNDTIIPFSHITGPSTSNPRPLHYVDNWPTKIHDLRDVREEYGMYIKRIVKSSQRMDQNSYIQLVKEQQLVTLHPFFL